MCGIAGIFNGNFKTRPGLERDLKLMNQLQAHRGPDDDKIWIHSERYLGFAHRRLSIIDLSSGNQPMTDRHGNWVVYGGEIYNYIELRHELGESNFSTHSDTEVILQA